MHKLYLVKINETTYIDSHDIVAIQEHAPKQWTVCMANGKNYSVDYHVMKMFFSDLIDKADKEYHALDEKYIWIRERSKK